MTCSPGVDLRLMARNVRCAAGQSGLCADPAQRLMRVWDTAHKGGVMPEECSAISFQVPFTLRPVADVEPWGKPGDRFLSWVALTDGAYCIETPAGRLLEYTWGDPPEDYWVTYQVVRIFEDLLEIWPHAAEVVPGDMAARFLAWYATGAYAQAADGWELDPLDAFDRASW